MSLSEADTCRKFVVPQLQAAGWDNEPHSIAEQRTITDGRIVPAGQGFVRKPPRRVDYLLRYERNFPLAVVEAKPAWKTAGDGLHQAKEYAEILGLKFAYASNGHEIIEFDYFTGRESIVPTYPTPGELWARYRAGAGRETAERRCFGARWAYRMVIASVACPRSFCSSGSVAHSCIAHEAKVWRRSWNRRGASSFAAVTARSQCFLKASQL